MGRLLNHFVEPPRACSYLSQRTAALEYKLMVDVDGAELEALLEHGWRRFGPAYFRPACIPCGECVSLRLRVAEFTPSRSQRRSARGCAALRIDIGPVRIDQERLDLYAAWHANREQTRQWEPSPITPQEYASQFAFPHPCAREIAYYDVATSPAAPRLVGVGICDETPRAWSAVYFFYDPAYAHRSLGAFHILTLAAVARQQRKSHVYLGFRIADCASMSYKARFHPHELLIGRPGPDDAPDWRLAPK